MEQKFRRNLARQFTEPQQNAILEISLNAEKLDKTPVHTDVDAYTRIAAKQAERAAG